MIINFVTVTYVYIGNRSAYTCELYTWVISYSQQTVIRICLFTQTVCITTTSALVNQRIGFISACRPPDQSTVCLSLSAFEQVLQTISRYSYNSVSSFMFTTRKVLHPIVQPNLLAIRLLEDAQSETSLDG